MPPFTRSRASRSSRSANRWVRFAGSLSRSASSVASSKLARNIVRALGNEVASSSKQAASKAVSDAMSYVSKKRIGQSFKYPASKRVKRSAVYRTLGRTGPKFPTKGSSSLSKFLKSGVSMKVEAGNTLTDADALYVGHYSLPVNRVCPAVFYALARRILNKNKCFPSDMLQPTGIEATTIYIKYRTTFTGLVSTSVGGSLAANASIVDMGNAIGRELLTVLTSALNYFEFVSMQVYETTGGDLLFEADATSISVELKATSNFHIQNRTKASGADTDQSSMLDIENNPLRGKAYFGWSNIHPYRFNNDTTTTCPALYHELNDGLLYVGANDATFTSQMSTAMKKPPPRSAFSNVGSTQYVKLAPGEIRKSTIHGGFTCSFNNFIQMYLSCMRGQTEIYSLTNALVSKGKSVFYGLEKVCDSGSESQSISVGFECTASINALVYVKSKNFVNPYVIT